jgi:deazaflavin-dependent oxidoreductase (nitroreductase family)
MKTPRGLLRLTFHLPVWLYRLHLGWLLGGRFLMLTTVGRKSGLPRRTVLEVVNHDLASGTYVVASGWGEKSDWYRNTQKNPNVLVHVGSRKYEAIAVRLPEEQAEQNLRDYAYQHPLAFQELSRFMTGQGLKDQEANIRLLVQSIPLIALNPKTSDDAPSTKG